MIPRVLRDKMVVGRPPEDWQVLREVRKRYTAEQEKTIIANYTRTKSTEAKQAYETFLAYKIDCINTVRARIN